MLSIQSSFQHKQVYTMQSSRSPSHTSTQSAELVQTRTSWPLRVLTEEREVPILAEGSVLRQPLLIDAAQARKSRVKESASFFC
eukprot:6185992-Pleurochrysis_carterae.AAC.1